MNKCSMCGAATDNGRYLIILCNDCLTKRWKPSEILTAYLSEFDCPEADKICILGLVETLERLLYEYAYTFEAYSMRARNVRAGGARAHPDAKAGEGGIRKIKDLLFCEDKVVSRKELEGRTFISKKNPQK